MPIDMTLTLKLAGVTYGELYEFVAAAQAAGVPAEETVRCLGSDGQGDRFEVELAGRSPQGGVTAAGVVNTGAAEAGHGDSRDSARSGTPQGVAELLRRSIRSESDVDKIVSMLGEMRKFLR